MSDFLIVANQTDGDFCAFCGHEFERTLVWPRLCSSCRATTEVKHIPLISVIAPLGEGVCVVSKRPRSTNEGIYLPSTFLDFGETWRQAAARSMGIRDAVPRFRNFDSLSLSDSLSNIFALVEDGALPRVDFRLITDWQEITCPHQRAVMKNWQD